MKREEVFSHTFKAMRKQIAEQQAEGRRLWQQRLGTASEFCRAVVSNGYLTEEQMQRAAQRYRLGASRDGGVIFWQIDECDLLRDGKIMHYRPDCHRDHDRKPTWATYLLRKNGRLPKDWNTDHCLFGLHLLMEDVRCMRADVKVAVVEAEKTAVIMSEVKPEYIWLATGGKTELNVAKLRPLKGHRVILFPDTERGRGCQRCLRSPRHREHAAGAARYPHSRKPQRSTSWICSSPSRKYGVYPPKV